MQVIGYIRVSTDKQDAQKQRHLLLQYAQQHKLLIDEFIEGVLETVADWYSKNLATETAKGNKERCPAGHSQQYCALRLPQG